MSEKAAAFAPGKRALLHHNPMTRLIVAAIIVAAIAAGLGVAGGIAIPRIVPQALFALALILVLLNVMNESDGKRG